MTPLVSILIPCYNAAAWLAATLDSALGQTHPACEIIVVDDGSSDDSLALARGYATRHPQISVQAQSNRGACSARNAAARLARGEFWQFLDADDLLAPDKIERQLALAATPAGSGRLISGEWLRFHGDPTAARSAPDALWADLDAVSWQVIALRENAMIHPAAWLVPRTLALQAGPWDESLTLNDDGEYFSRVRFASGQVPFCRGARSLYRSGLPGSLSSANSRRALQSAFRSHELIHTSLLEHEDSDRTRQACADGWMHFAFAAAPVAMDLATTAARLADELGGSRLAPSGALPFRLACRIFGWRRAFQLRKLLHR